jgi:hypothetical protein
LTTPTLTPSASKSPQPRPGELPSKFAGRTTLSSDLQELFVAFSVKGMVA